MKKAVLLLFLCGAALCIACGGKQGSDTVEQLPAIYSVTYNSNNSTGGVVPLNSNLYAEHQIVIVAGNTGSLYKDNYSFGGWNTQSDGSGLTFSQNQLLRIGSSDMVLYAKWTANKTYSVTYDSNGATTGSIPVDTTNYINGQSVTVLSNTGNLDKTGYSFNGWNTAQNGYGTTYTQSQTFAMGNANVILYAKWTAKSTYTITYNGYPSTSGIVPTDNTRYETGQMIQLMSNTGNLMRSYYVFAGWNTSQDGTGTTYLEGQQIAMGSANITMYAKWSHRVFYKANGATDGTQPVDNTIYAAGQSVTILDNVGNLSRPGYIFNGWNTSSSGGSTSYTPGQITTMGSSNLVLYAQWKSATKYSLTYLSNGATAGSVPADSGQYMNGQTATASGNTGSLSKKYCTFDGWNTAADGSGTTYADGDTVSFSYNNIILYAKWKSKASTLGSGLTANSVNAITCDTTGNLYAGGIITKAGETTVSNIAKWDGVSWSALGTGVNRDVNTLACDSSGSLYAGGSFTSAGGVQAYCVAKWNGTAWSSLNATGLDGGNSVKVLTFDASGNLYIAGSLPFSNVMKWNGTSWATLGNMGTTSSGVCSMTISKSGTLYVGGGFADKEYNISQWNGSAWINVGAGTDTTVFSLISDSYGNIYAGGAFNAAGTVYANSVAKWNGSTWSTLGAGMSGLTKMINSFAFDSEGNLYAGGWFTYADGVAVNSLAVWNGTCWSPIGSGIGSHGYVCSICIDKSDNLYVAGIFTTAGGISALNIVKFEK